MGKREWEGARGRRGGAAGGGHESQSNQNQPQNSTNYSFSTENSLKYGKSSKMDEALNSAS